MKALKTIKALDERFATDYTVNVIVGKLTPQIKMFRHEGLAEFGIGNEDTEYYWNSLLRQLLLEDLLVKDIEEYGVLKITKKGQEFLKKPRSFEIVLNNAFEEANAEDDEETAEAAPEVTASDEKLFTMLMELRQKESKKKGLPPFVLFLENSMQDMATFYPTTALGTGKMPGREQGKSHSLWQTLYRTDREIC